VTNRPVHLRREGIPWVSARVLAPLTGLAWVGIMAVRLFVGGTVGMADNGDSRRLMCQLGVRAAKPFAADAGRYLYPVWVAHHWYGEACGADGSGEPYRSSELWLLSMAKHLTPLLGFSGTLDLRALGVIACVIVGLAVGLLVALLPGGWVARVVVASVFGLAVADGAIAEYFMSPYSEPAALLGSLFLCVTLLWMWRRGTTTWGGLILTALVGAFTMAAKTQMVALLPALWLAILWLPHDGTDFPPLSPQRIGSAVAVFGRDLQRRLPALLTAGVLLVSAVVILDAAPKRFNQIDAYDEVFNEILVHSSNRTADLRSLGVDPQLAYAAGSNVLSNNSAATSPEYLQFRSHVTEGVILQFYLTHPTRLFPVFGDGLHAMSVWRQNYLGTYTAGPGHRPGALENRVGIFTDIFHGRPTPIFVVFWLAILGFGFFTARDRRAALRERAVGRLAVVLAVATAFEFWAVLLGEGRSDLYKHMVLANELFAFGVCTLLVCVVSRVKSFYRIGPASAPAAKQPAHEETAAAPTRSERLA
jgi:hypothetical protein